MAEVFNPDALATSGDSELDTRPGVQHVDEFMIRRYVTDTNALPVYSALPFSVWADSAWDDFNEDGTCTNRDVLNATLHDWCGGRERPTTERST